MLSVRPRGQCLRNSVSPSSSGDDYRHPQNTSLKIDSFRAYVIGFPWSVL